MMQRCGTCKHWGTGDSREYIDKRYRFCAGVDVNDGCSGCSSGSVNAGDDLAMAVDNSGFWAALKCREDFGCVLWEQK